MGRVGILRRRDHLAILTSRFIPLLALLAGCAEAPFGEGDPPDDECGPVAAFGPGNGGSLEIGRLQGGAFVPLVGGETFELLLSGDPYGWSFAAAFRYPLESPPNFRVSCFSFQTFETNATGGSVPGAISRGHPGRWVEDPTTPSIGRWESVGEAQIVVGTNLETLLAMPKTFSVKASVEGFAQGSPAITLKFTNSEGFDAR